MRKIYLHPLNLSKQETGDKHLGQSQGFSKKRKMREPAWKKHQVKRKWQSIASVFITVTLVFAIVNGLAKGISFKNQLATSKWDGKSSMAVAINTRNPSVFIFQTDPKSAVVLTNGSNIFYQSGKEREVLQKVTGDILNSPQDLTRMLSHTYGVKIDNYLMLNGENGMDDDIYKKLFINFASITTPLKLLTYGWGDNIKSTNVSRLDAIRLWWQLKSISFENLSVNDLSTYSAEIINYENQKVLGADTVSINRVISNYLENIAIVSENKKIRIQNGSENPKAAKLAASFIESVGGNVVEVSNNDFEYTQTQIIAKDKKSYTLGYLEKIFNCDINGAQNSGASDEIIVIVGADFADTYFE